MSKSDTGYSFKESNKEEVQTPLYIRILTHDNVFYIALAVMLTGLFAPSIYADMTEPMVEASVSFDNPVHSSDIYVMTEQDEGFFGELNPETYYVVATENQRGIYKDLNLNSFSQGLDGIESERAWKIGAGEYMVESYSMKPDVPGMYERDWFSKFTIKDPSHGGVQLREGDWPKGDGKLKANQSKEFGWFETKAEVHVQKYEKSEAVVDDPDNPCDGGFHDIDNVDIEKCPNAVKLE